MRDARARPARRASSICACSARGERARGPGRRASPRSSRERSPSTRVTDVGTSTSSMLATCVSGTRPVAVGSTTARSSSSVVGPAVGHDRDVERPVAQVDRADRTRAHHGRDGAGDLRLGEPDGCRGGAVDDHLHGRLGRREVVGDVGRAVDALDHGLHLLRERRRAGRGRRSATTTSTVELPNAAPPPATVTSPRSCGRRRARRPAPRLGVGVVVERERERRPRACRPPPLNAASAPPGRADRRLHGGHAVDAHERLLDLLRGGVLRRAATCPARTTR